MAVCARRVRAVAAYLNSSCPLTEQGYNSYLSQNLMHLAYADRQALLDFCRWYGIRQTKKTDPPAARLRPKPLSDEARQRISSFLQWCMDRREYSDHSLRMKSQQLTRYFSCMESFSAEGCHSFMMGLSKRGIHPRTQNMYMITLRQFGEFSGLPVIFRKITVPRCMSVENVPSQQEYDSFLRHLQEQHRWTSYWVARILGSTGMRLSELRQISWADILTGEAFPRCKGKKYRMIYFPARLASDLRQWLNGNPRDISEPVIISRRTGRILTDRGLTRTLKADAEACGFPREKAHCHAFRHFFAKQFLARSQDIAQLAELLGHESVDTTRLYLQKSRSEQHRAINQLVDW